MNSQGGKQVVSWRNSTHTQTHAEQEEEEEGKGVVDNGFSGSVADQSETIRRKKDPTKLCKVH